MSLKLKIKKAKMVRKIDGVPVTGYIGRVISNGKAAFDEIARDSTKNTTLHPQEAALAAAMLLEGVCEKLKNGYIVDMGPLGTLYPSVTGVWKQTPDELTLSSMTPKVNYRPSDDIAGAIRGASLAFTTSEGTEETTTPEPEVDDNTGTYAASGPTEGTGNNTADSGTIEESDPTDE